MSACGASLLSSRLEKVSMPNASEKIIIAVRISISIFRAKLFFNRPVNGARRGCRVRVMGGDHAIGGQRLPTDMLLAGEKQ